MEDVKIDERDTYTIYDDQSIGKVQIADEVVAIIAGLAATETEGVASMNGHITNAHRGDGGRCPGGFVPVSEIWLQHPRYQRAGTGKGKDSD